MLIFAGTVMAQTMETNVSGLVIKDLKCLSYFPTHLSAQLINRNSELFAGKIRIKIIDRENDIIWQGLESVKVEGQNGTTFSTTIGVGTCLAPNKIQLTLER